VERETYSGVVLTGWRRPALADCVAVCYQAGYVSF